MSCNGCRVLRKGCNEGCALRPCLEWIERPEAQGFATLFLAKFFGRAGLLEFITAVPNSQRTALFQSLLYEACGRTVNPVFGAVGLLWSGKWHLCQEAVETILNGGSLQTSLMRNRETFGHSLSTVNRTSIPNLASIGASQTMVLPSSRAWAPPHSSLFNLPSMSLATAQQCQNPNMACKLVVSPPSLNPLEGNPPLNHTHKRLKLSINSENLESRSLILQSRPGGEGSFERNYRADTMHHRNSHASYGGQQSTTNPQHPHHTKHALQDMVKYSSSGANEDANLALTLTSNSKKGGASSSSRKEDFINNGGRVSSPSEGSIVTSLGSPRFASTLRHHLPTSPPSPTSHQELKLLNLLV